MASFLARAGNTLIESAKPQNAAKVSDVQKCQMHKFRSYFLHNCKKAAKTNNNQRQGEQREKILALSFSLA